MGIHFVDKIPGTATRSVAIKTQPAALWSVIYVMDQLREDGNCLARGLLSMQESPNIIM